MEACFGIDIGGTNTVIGLVSEEGKLLAEGQISTTALPELHDYLDALAVEMRRLGDSLTIKVRGIGIGAPNGNYYQGTIEHAPNLLWRDVIPLAAEMEERFPAVPVYVTNDANAAALGELLYGAARGLEDFLLITLGTGLGSGYVANGELVLGHDGFAGELGHVVVDWNGRACGCGRQGCLETYASVTGLVKTTLLSLDKSDESSSLRELARHDLDGKSIADAATAGDKLALEAFEETGRILGRALANSVAITSPQKIFIFGGLAHAGELILEPTRRHMENNLLEIYRDKVSIELSELMNKNAAILGAGALAWKEVQA